MSISKVKRESRDCKAWYYHLSAGLDDTRGHPTWNSLSRKRVLVVSGGGVETNNYITFPEERRGETLPAQSGNT